MKNIELVVPGINEYQYKKMLEEDKDTMSYNAGYNVSYEGYNYDTGCIKFNKSKWELYYNRKDKYFAYIKDCEKDILVGYVNYQYNDDNIYECGILIEYKYRGYGYAKEALKLLVKKAYNDGIKFLYDSFEKNREDALKLFLSIGFKVYKSVTWKKLNIDVDGVVLRIDTSLCKEF